MPEKLKPCPFCGGEAKMEKNNSTVTIKCKSCTSSVWSMVDPEWCAVDRAREYWNRRAESDL